MDLRFMQEFPCKIDFAKYIIVTMRLVLLNAFENIMLL